MHYLLRTDYFDVEDFKDDIKKFTINELVDATILVGEGGSVGNITESNNGRIRLTEKTKENR